MQPIFTDRPGELLSIDFYGPLPPSTAGAKYLLTTIDVFCKFVVIYPIKNANTATVIRKILQDYIPKYGKPAKIICDHGTQFTSKLWAKKLREENISLIFSSIRHPQSNIVERVHRELGRFFRTLTADQRTKWATYVPTIQTIINETHHETTQKMPWELHFQTPSERIWTKWVLVPDKENTSLEDRIFVARDTMHSKLKKRARKTNENIKHFHFQIGDAVLIRANNVSSEKHIAKFFHVYEGPYFIKESVGKDTYLLSHPSNGIRGKFHLSLLKPYYSRSFENKD